MLYRILAVGDVVGQNGVQFLKKHLRAAQKFYNIQFTVVNGENAQMVGLNREDAEAMFSAGADVITLGNHTFGKMQISQYLDDCPYILRPANLGERVPGRGCGMFGCGHIEIRVINLIGRVDMRGQSDNPFKAVDKLLNTPDHPRFTLVDFHAEATSEKIAMGYCFDGKFAVLFGTHTHVPTADTKILPGGTGYVTDLGMCGPEESVIGCEIEPTIRRLRTLVPVRFHAATGPSLADGVLFTVDEEKNRCVKVERVKF